MPAFDKSAEVAWTQWKSIKEERTIKDKVQQVSLTLKKEEKGTVRELVTGFNEQLKQFKKHQFNICHQYRHYRSLRQQMKDNECLIHIDFSENYVAKLASAISSAHYGASKHQITLHTGVYYLGPSGKPKPFCSLTDSLHHGPGAIWAHLDPVIDYIAASHPSVDTLHFYSDGPTTQYRQKGNFYKFTTVIYEKGFIAATWNFSEAGHGKGAPDGIGATLKRTADQIVAHGTDIPNAIALYEQLKKVFFSVFSVL